MTTAPAPRISVIIPVRNEAAGLAACLDGILSQTVRVHEIIVIDSGSDDGTQDIARRYEQVRLIEIPPSEFNHGDTRNLGVRESTGDMILFTVGDARPVDDRWVEKLLAGFLTPDVVAVGGVQVVPHSADANPLDWYRPASTPQTSVHSFGSTAAFDAATGAERRSACVLDDVTAIYRRDILETIPFRRLVYGEDLLFAIDALRAGHTLVRQPSAQVYHFHVNNYATTLKRTIAVGSLRHELFGMLPAMPVDTPLHNAVRLLREPGLPMAAKLRWWRHKREIMRALRDGTRMLHKAQAEGVGCLVALQEKYSGTPPVPLKRREKDAA